MSEPTLEILSSETLKHVSLCCRALDDKKGEDIQVLDVREKSSVTDYFVLVTGTSQPHLKALRDNVEKTLKDHKIKTHASDYTQDSGWLVLDGFDFMLHIFTAEMRANYGLESLWKDAARIELTELLGEES